jgi:hypothetical protein
MNNYTRAANAVQAAAMEIDRFVKCIFVPTDFVEVRLLPSGRGTWHRADALMGEALRLHQENVAGQNVYVGVNPRTCVGDSTAADVAIARCVFVNLVDLTFEQVAARFQSSRLPEPTMGIMVGNAFHAFWRLDVPIPREQLHDWSTLQRQLAAKLGSDPVDCHLPCLVRLPGFYNVDTQPWVACTLLSARPDVRFGFAALQAAVGLPAQVPVQTACLTHDSAATVSSLSNIGHASQYLGVLEPAVQAVQGHHNNTGAFPAAAALVNDLQGNDEVMRLLAARNEPRPVLVALSEVQPEPVRWLWPNRIALGKLTLLVGEPGVGKSFVTLDLTGRVSRGYAFPDAPGSGAEPQ